MKKKINKKLLNLIALCSGITATVGLGIGGVIYSLRQEKDGGDQPIDQKVLPESVYKFSDDGKTLLGFQDDFLNNSASPIYKDNFKNCDTMEIPAKVEIICPNAFDSNEREVVPSYITKLTFAKKSNCSSVASNAFFHCTYLTSIDFSNATKLEILCNSCFAECSLLTSVTSPSSLTRISPWVFYKCSSLNDIKWESWTGSFDSLFNDASFSGVCPTGGTVTVENPVDGHDSDELLEYLLDNGGLPSTWAKDVTNPLPESVYDINENNVLLGFKDAFLNDPDSEIYKDNFKNCDTMEIPADVTWITQSAFRDQNVPSFIKNLTFAEGSKLERINACAFKNCSSLTSVDLLNTNISTIAVSAFEGCLELKSISFPSSLTTIDGIVFDNCPNLSSIIWNAWQGNATVYSSSFSGVCQTGGTVTVTNPKDDSHNSDALLNYLLENGGLPDGWTAA